MPDDKIQLSKHGSSFMQRKLNSKRKAAEKSHGYDARNYHQNANRHGIHALTTFDCPICQCKNTVKVELNTTSHIAIVKCSYCTSLTPRPIDLPYPFSTPYVPKLENRADAFFRFSESYRKLLASTQNNNNNINSRYGNSNASVLSETTEKEYERDRINRTSRRGLLDDVRDIIEHEEHTAHTDSSDGHDETQDHNINDDKQVQPTSDDKHTSIDDSKNTKSDNNDDKICDGESNEVDDVFAFFNDDSEGK